jgi:hypothetical protein
MEAVRNRLDAEALQAALREDAVAYSALSAQAMDLHRKALGPGNPALAPYLVNHLLVAGYQFPRLLPARPNDWLREAVELIEHGLDAGDESAVRTLILLSGYDQPNRQLVQLQAKAFDLVNRNAKGRGQRAAEELDLLADLLEKPPAASKPEESLPSAERTYREILALRRKTHPSGSPELSRVLVALTDLLVRKARALASRADPAGAEAAYREAMTLARESGSGSELRAAKIGSELGKQLLSLGRLGEAEPLLTGSLRAIRTEINDDRNATVQAALNRLADLHVALGRPADAARYRGMLPAISVADVRDLGPVRFVPMVRKRITASGASFAGRPVWIFTDTLTAGGGAAPWKSLDGAWGFVEPAEIGALPKVVSPTDGTGAPFPLIPRTAAEADQEAASQREGCSEAEVCESRFVLAPGAAIWDRERGRALIFYTKTVRGSQGKGARVGTSIAIWPDLDAPAVRPILRPAAADPTLLFDAEEPPWGSAAFVEGESMYVYACEGRAGSLESPCFLARVPLARVLDRTAWRFHAGHGTWSADWRAARPVLDKQAPLSVHRNEYLGKYLAIAAGVLSSRLDIATADRPEGPWTPWSENLLVEALPPPRGSPWIKTGLGHPELSRDGGRVETLSYVRWDGESGDETRVLEIEFRKQTAQRLATPIR